MRVAPEIIFHDLDRSAWVENYVAERLKHLERFARDIIRCRVTLAQEQGSHRKGNRYSVMVEVRIPPQHDLAVKKQKQIRDMRTQLPAMINEAFGAIERQLKKTVALRRGDAKSHNGQPRGMVEKLSDEGRNSVLHGDFEQLNGGTGSAPETD
jgi:ribosomal subunit interface protein